MEFEVEVIDAVLKIRPALTATIKEIKKLDEGAAACPVLDALRQACNRHLDGLRPRASVLACCDSRAITSRPKRATSHDGSRYRSRASRDTPANGLAALLTRPPDRSRWLTGRCCERRAPPGDEPFA
jgi:hypothetical protein